MEAAERVVARPVRNSKKISRRGKGSQTPGKTKGERCMTGKMKKYMACSPKAYKHSQYEKWHEMFKKMNLGGK